MDARKFHLHDGQRGAAIAVRVTPKAMRNEIKEILPDGTVKVHLTAAASEKRINEILLDFLSEVLGVPKGKLDIVAGIEGIDKLVSIMDMNTDEVQKRLVAHFP